MERFRIREGNVSGEAIGVAGRPPAVAGESTSTPGHNAGDASEPAGSGDRGAADGVVRAATFLDGVRASFPIVMGYFPIAFSFGAAATERGFSAAEAVLLSAVVYSGASQFMALTLLAGGTGIVVSILTLLAMNLRHVLYGPSLLDRVGRRVRTRWAPAWAFGLTDEVYATSIGFLSSRREAWSERWMLGIGASAYASWVAGTVAGAVAGGGALSRYPSIEAALGFMLPALFVALLFSILDRKSLPVVIVAGVVCTVVAGIADVTTGILAGMAVGAIVGAVRSGRSARRLAQ